MSTIVFTPVDFPNVSPTLVFSLLLQVTEYRYVKGENWRCPLWRQLYHVVNHSTYHCGQVATMWRQLGATLAATDFLAYDDQGRP